MNTTTFYEHFAEIKDKFKYCNTDCKLIYNIVLNLRIEEDKFEAWTDKVKKYTFKPSIDKLYQELRGIKKEN